MFWTTPARIFSRSSSRKSRRGGPPLLLTRMSGAGQAASSAAWPSGVLTSAATAFTSTLKRAGDLGGGCVECLPVTAIDDDIAAGFGERECAAAAEPAARCADDRLPAGDAEIQERPSNSPIRLTRSRVGLKGELCRVDRSACNVSSGGEAVRSVLIDLIGRKNRHGNARCRFSHSSSSPRSRRGRTTSWCWSPASTGAWCRRFPHILGIAFGFPVMIVALGLGLGVVFEAYPWLHRRPAVCRPSPTWSIWPGGSPRRGNRRPMDWRRKPADLPRGRGVPVGQSEGLGDHLRRARPVYHVCGKQGLGSRRDRRPLRPGLHSERRCLVSVRPRNCRVSRG